MGYGSYSLQTAVADIVDNSITAGADNIEVSFVWGDADNEESYVEIKDNGCGMSSSELEKAMIFSEKGINDTRTDNDLGKYGLGMKTASMYACRCLTVISKKDNHFITAKRLDRDYVDEQKEWIGIDLDDDDSLKSLDLPRGTIVRWDKLSFTEKGKNSKNYFLKYVRDVHEHLELIFHRFIERENIKIFVNGNLVKAWNPICPHPATTKFDFQSLLYEGNEIRVSSYLMPSALSCSEQDTEYIYRGNALKYQGFFVYRKNRLLIDGSWLDIKKGNSKLSSHQAYNPVRIIVDIPSSLDNILKVDFTKSSLKFPVEVEEQLYKIANKVRKKAKEQSRSRAYAVPMPGEKLEEIWKLKKKDDEYLYSINKTHPLIKRLTKDMEKKDFDELMQLLAKTVPPVGAEKKFITSFTVEEMDRLIQSYYLEQLTKNKAWQSIRDEMKRMEPFNQFLDLVDAFFANMKVESLGDKEEEKNV